MYTNPDTEVRFSDPRFVSIRVNSWLIFNRTGDRRLTRVLRAEAGRA